MCGPVVIARQGFAGGESASRQVRDTSGKWVHYKKHCMVSAHCLSEVL